MSFYNTYRPQTFGELHSAKVRTLLESFLNKDKVKLPHAFLLSGPKGIGKTTTARLIAKYFNCTKPLKNGEPCGSCDTCKRIASGSLIDVLEIDGASNTGVDNIRDIKDKIMLAPSSAEFKVYIIDEVHMLSTGAFNALLKTLEEPPRNTVFILATTDLHKVPETIQSRCLMLNFQKPDLEELITALKQIAEKEKISITPEVLALIATQANGSFRDAVKLLEQAGMTNKVVDVNNITQLLNLPEEKIITELMEKARIRNISAIIEIIESLSLENFDTREIYRLLILKLQQELISVIRKSTQSNWSIPELHSLLTILLEYFAGTRNHGMSSLALELALVTFCNSHTSQTATSTKSETSESTKTSIPTPKLMPQPIKPATDNISNQNTTNDLQLKKDSISTTNVSSMLDLNTLSTHWVDIVKNIQTSNHSLAGVLRSARPKSVEDDILTIETMYAFHKDKLSEAISKAAIAKTVKALFGENVTIEIVLGKK